MPDPLPVATSVPGRARRYRGRVGDRSFARRLDDDGVVTPLMVRASADGSALEGLSRLHVRSTEVRLRELGPEGPRQPLLETLGPRQRLVRLEVLVDAVKLRAVCIGEHIVLLQRLANDAIEIERSGALRRHDGVMR